MIPRKQLAGGANSIRDVCETVIPRKQLAAKVEPSFVVRAFVTPEAVEPTGAMVSPLDV